MVIIKSVVNSLFLKVELSAQFHQPPAHDLYRVPPLVVLETVPRLLVEDGAVVEKVIDVKVSLQLLRLAQPEDPAETEVKLFDPLSVECVVRNQIDRCGLRTGSRGLAGAGRQMAAQRSTDLSIADHITRSYGKSGLILVNRTDLDIFRKRVDRIETERGPT